MTLKYLGGPYIELLIRRFPRSRLRRYVFSPLCEVDPRVAYRIFRDSRYTGMFREEYIAPPTFPCKYCKVEFETQASLNGHLRKHGTIVAIEKEEKKREDAVYARLRKQIYERRVILAGIAREARRKKIEERKQLITQETKEQQT